MQSIANKVINRIYGHGRGWAFTPKDFSDFGDRSAIDVSLNRLVKQGLIRRVGRGVYDFPQFSKLFKATVSADFDQIARAIARCHGWSITPSGETSLNLLGLSTQVPGKYIYYSDGPSKEYSIGNGEIVFIKRANKEIGALSTCTALTVQAIKALGQKHITPEVLKKLREKLTGKEKNAALHEARYVTGWVYEVIKKIAE
jgi:hypothetical protein